MSDPDIERIVQQAWSDFIHQPKAEEWSQKASACHCARVAALLAHNAAMKRCLEIARSQEKSSYMEGVEDMQRWKERGGKDLSPLSWSSGAATRAASNIVSAIEKETRCELPTKCEVCGCAEIVTHTYDAGRHEYEPYTPVTVSNLKCGGSASCVNTLTELSRLRSALASVTKGKEDLAQDLHGACSKIQSLEYSLASAEKRLKENEEERCPDCNGELSCCGEMTADGPSMDCRVCQLTAELATVTKERDEAREVIAQHDLCHNLHGKVDARAFADGCNAEQRKLYGCAPDADHLAIAVEALERARTEIAPGTRTQCLTTACREREETLALIEATLSKIKSKSMTDTLNDAIARHVERSAQSTARIPRHLRTILSKAEAEDNTLYNISKEQAMNIPDEEIVKALAERELWHDVEASQHSPSGYVGMIGPCRAFMPIPNYLSDRNALACVMGAMPEDEFHSVWSEIVIWSAKNNVVITGRWLLTCDPRVIAECMTRAIQKGKA